MLRMKLLLVPLTVVLVILANANAAIAESTIVRVASNAGKGFWGLMLRTPEAVLVDVSSGVANLISGVTLIFSDIFSLGDRAPAGRFAFDSIFSDGLDEFACFMHTGGANAIEIGTRRDFSNIPIEREAFLQREGIFHKEALRTFPYSIKSFALAALDLVTGIPANACRMVGLTDAADSITKGADSAAEAWFGTIQWKYTRD